MQHSEPQAGIDLEALGAQIPIWAEELGFQATGITDIDLAAVAPAVRGWLEQGYHGDMAYMRRHLDKRLHPERLEAGTLRVISARMNYLTDGAEPRDVIADPAAGYIARYALGRDYHKVVRRRLARLARRIQDAVAPRQILCRPFTDSAPVLEKPLAAKAGLGWVGKHTLLLDSQAGSYFFLGEIYTDLALPLRAATVEDACGHCQACMTVCPTQAIVAPGKLDARRCIAYLTIEHKGAIEPDLRRHMGNRVFGCDDCQIFCPWNRDAPQTAEADFGVRHDLDNPSLLELFQWDEATFLARTEGSALRRINYEQWQRNLAIALGNGAPSPAVVAALRARRVACTPLVAEHIDWALEQLAGT